MLRMISLEHTIDFIKGVQALAFKSKKKKKKEIKMQTDELQLQCNLTFVD